MCDFADLGFAEKKYFDFPNIVNLEVFRGDCPCSCVHCPVGKVAIKDRRKRFGLHSISMDLLKSIVDEMKHWPHSTVRLHSVGEPILWPKLIPALQYISEASVRSWIFTSLVTDRYDILEALCEYCDIVEVSVNSICAEDYLHTKGIDAFAVVAKNIKYMSDYIKHMGLKTRLIASRVQSDSLDSDIKFVQYWKNSGIVSDAFVRKYHSYNNLIEPKFEGISKKSACLVHWMRFNIAYDGTVVACFNELFHQQLRSDVILGHLGKASIYEIWHSGLYNQLRKAELSGYTDSHFPLDFPCRNCLSCQSYDGKHETSEHQINALGEERPI